MLVLMGLRPLLIVHVNMGMPEVQMLVPSSVDRGRERTDHDLR